MKTIKKLPLFFLSLLLCSFKPQDIKQADKQITFTGKAYDKTQMLDLTDNTEEEIKQYYDYDTMVTKKGDDLKSYLYSVIKKDNYFLKYGTGTSYSSGGVGAWYKISDRNWYLSKEINPATYVMDEEKEEDYYLVNFYFEAKGNYDKTKATNNNVNSTKFKEVEGATKVDYTNYTKPKGVSTDKEHLWAKNHGFKNVVNKKDTFLEGAPTDLHHLVAADGNTNSAGHNDLFFGEVSDKASSTTVYCYYADGSKAVSGYRGKDQKGNAVFEPTDEWKGDIARALLYMATRYSVKLEGGNTQGEPYLVFDEEGSYKSDTNPNGKYDRSQFQGYHPNLSTYLKWNKEDPVSEYEYHRNNLIYKNIQRNRNPYIDYPELADWVFLENDETPLTLVQPVDDNPYSQEDFSKLENKYEVHVDDEIDLDLKYGAIQDLKVEYDNNIISLSSDYKKFKALKAGTTTLTYSYTDKEGKKQEKKTTIEVRDKIILLSCKPDVGVFDHMDLVTGEEWSFELTFKDNNAFFPDERIIYSTDDPSIISVTDEGKVTALKAGECKLYLIVQKGTKQKNLIEFNVKVTLSEEEQKKKKLYTLIIIIAAILLLIIFLIFYFLIKKTNRKNDTKAYTKVYNKKGSKKKKVTKKSSQTNSKKGGNSNGRRS